MRLTPSVVVPGVLAILGLLSACGPEKSSTSARVGSVLPAATRPGARSRDLLRESPSPRLHVEIIPVVNHDPDVSSVLVLLDRILANCRKPSGVTAAVLPPVTAEVQTGSATTRWTLADLESFERRHRATKDGDDSIVLEVLYLDGVYAGDPKTPGLAYNDHAIAVFRDAAPGVSESRVLVHQLGHLLGLVSGETRMVAPHEDEESPGHCRASTCVMARAGEGTDPAATTDDFDELCKADLAAVVNEPATSTDPTPRTETTTIVGSSAGTSTYTSIDSSELGR